MEAVPRLPMINCDLKTSPSNTEFGPILKKYIRDHYHEDPESYSKEIKDLETLRQNAIKAPMDFTGCSILKRYYSQLHKLQNRFPMTDDGAACVPFMWSDIYSGVAYNITDIEYEEACILYNIGALHSKLGTMDSRCNAEGMKIACTHFQCAAWAFQHLRDTYPQPKGSDMSHDLLTFFINIMLAQAQECILEKSMLDNRKSSITAKIAVQVVDYYKCALGIMVSGSPSTDTGSVLDIVGSKIFKGWKKFIEFKMSYYTSISHLYMGNQAEENEKWGERVAWFQSASDHLAEAFKLAKGIDQDELDEPLTFTMDVIGGKLNSSKKENEFVYHDKVPSLNSLPELKGASLVKGIPFSTTDPEVSGPDIFARLVPMEAHETSSLYSEEKAKILRSVAAKIETKNEELMAYLSSLQLESGTFFQGEEKIPQDLLEKCAAMSVRPTAIPDLTELMNELLGVSKDVEAALKVSKAILIEEEQKELKHQETFGNRGPSMIIVELKKECSKYEEAHKKAVESNNTLQAAVNIHLVNLAKLTSPLEELTGSLPSLSSIKTPDNIKVMEDFNNLVNKVEEMRKQRHYLEHELRDSLMKDDITKCLITLDKQDLQQTFAEELKKHSEILTYLDQNLAAQDNILCALTEANAHYADTRRAMTEIKHQRDTVVQSLINSYEAYDDLISKTKKGLEFYKKLQNNVTRLLTRIKSVTKVQDEERSQIAEAELRKGSRVSEMPGVPSVLPSEQHVPKLKDYLPFMTKRGAVEPTPVPAASYSNYHLTQTSLSGNNQFTPEPARQATLRGPTATEFDRKLKPSLGESTRIEETYDIQSMGVRPSPVGSEQTSFPAICTTVSDADIRHMTVYSTSQQWPNAVTPPTTFSSSYGSASVPYHYPTLTSPQLQMPMEPKPIIPNQPLQPAAVNSFAGTIQTSYPSPSVDQHSKHSPVESQINSLRDLITPPPESEATKFELSDKADSSSFQVLQPKVIDLKNIAQLKEKEIGHLAKDPLDDSSVRAKFVSEVEKYEKFVDGLVRKSLNGTTPLDQKWKEFTDAQDKESRKVSISVARCYPLKNRYPDVMPYDSNRVKLSSAKDDYINGSYLKDICSSSPVFILTQAPLPSTFNDFWLMVWEQQVETLICLLSDCELKNHVYFPKERGQTLTCGAYEISLHNHKEKSGFTERMINVTHIKNRTSRVVVHLQFSQWPASAVPSSPAPLLQFISEVLNYQKQQRNLMRPVVVHCSAGIGRSGCFCLVTALVSEMNNGHGPKDVAQVAGTVSPQRKFLIQEKDQLKFCYDAVLYYAQDLLMRRGILTTRASFDDKLPGSGNSSSHVRHPSEDFILGSGGLAKLQSGIAKMGLSTDSMDGSIKASDPGSSLSKISSITMENGNEPRENNNVEVPRTETVGITDDSDNKATELETCESSKEQKSSEDKNVLSITSLLDPSNFTLEASNSPGKRKITKENFAHSKGSLSTSSSDSGDPLSQLDPLWSLKK